jgi:hypothetical protein
MKLRKVKKTSVQLGLQYGTALTDEDEMGIFAEFFVKWGDSGCSVRSDLFQACRWTSRNLNTVSESCKNMSKGSTCQDEGDDIIP